MKRTILLLGIVVSIGLWMISCGNKATSEQSTHSDSTQKPASKTGQSFKRGEGKFSNRMNRPRAAIPVEISYIVPGDISDYLMYSAALETEQTVTVYSQINGLIVKLYVEEGQWVNKGDSLLQLDPREYILAEQKARVEYDKQLSNFERLKGLKAKDLVSDEEFETARLNVKQAEIAWRQAKLNLEYTTVRAPISGVIGERLVNLGARIQPSTALFTLSNLAQKIVKVYVPQNEMAKVHRNQKAQIQSDVLPGETFEGWVKRVSPVVDPQSGTFKVTVGVRDPKNKLKPGMFVNVHLIVDTHENVPLIPKTSLVYENERSYFFVLKDNVARKIELQKGYEDAEKVEIKNKLPLHTPIVVVGQNGLKDGSRVRVTEVRRYTWQQNFPEEKAKEVQQLSRHSGQQPKREREAPRNRPQRPKNKTNPSK